MTTRCTVCGKKVPKKRLTEGASPYSGFFCTTACHLSYSDKMLAMMRETELEVQAEIKRESGVAGPPEAAGAPGNGGSVIDAALDAIDHAAAAATNGSQSPEEIAAKFLGTFAGKFGVKLGTKLYGSFADAAKAWSKKREEASKAAGAQTPVPPPSPAPAPPPAATPAPSTPPPGPQTTTGQPKTPGPAQPPPAKPQQGPVPPRPAAPGQGPSAAPFQQPGAPPRQPGAARQPFNRPKRIKEPEDLEDLPLDEQRVWLLKRFFLPPTATMEEVQIRYKACAKRFHPDRPGGNQETMKVINATRQRLMELDKELQPTGRRKKK